MLCLAAVAQTCCGQLRIATYNITNYNGTDREGDLQTIFYMDFQGRKLAPDVIVCQEFINVFALNTFRTLLNIAPGSPGDWQSAPFIDGADTESVLLYRTSKVDYLGTTVVSVGSSSSTNHPRNIYRYDLRLKGYSSEGATFSYYSTHMKAGSTQTDMDRRLVEAQKIRDNAETLPPARQFLLGGDFNIGSSTETAYIELVGSQVNNVGRFYDPIKSPGAWGSGTFRYIHTQDPAGAGGMDDRYDQILTGAGLIDGIGFDYIGNPNLAFSTSTWNDPNHSYRCWGNDGTSYNTTLRVAGNTMVGPTIAQALINAASGQGHLPVYMECRVPAKAFLSTSSIYFGKVFQGMKAPTKSLTIANNGDTSLWNASGISNLNYSFNVPAGFVGVGGSFSATAGGPSNTHSFTMPTNVPGKRYQMLTIDTDDPEQPVRQVLLYGEVIPLIGR